MDKGEMDKRIRDLIFDMKDEFMLFHLLSHEQMEKAVPYLDVVDYSKGSILLKEGEYGDFLAFIVRGKMEVKKQTEFAGKQIVLATLGRGSLVGELSFINSEEPRSATVAALEDSEVVILRRDALDELTRQHPEIGVLILKGMIRILAIRLRKAVERLSYVF
jgi:CRP-like cAMP-binding protein